MYSNNCIKVHIPAVYLYCTWFYEMLRSWEQIYLAGKASIVHSFECMNNLMLLADFDWGENKLAQYSVGFYSREVRVNGCSRTELVTLMNYSASPKSRVRRSDSWQWVTGHDPCFTVSGDDPVKSVIRWSYGPVGLVSAREPRKYIFHHHAYRTVYYFRCLGSIAVLIGPIAGWMMLEGWRKHPPEWESFPLLFFYVGWWDAGSPALIIMSAYKITCRDKKRGIRRLVETAAHRHG